MAILANANDVLIDLNGNRAYLTDNKLYVHDSSDTTIVPSFLQTNESDLGEPAIDKLLNMFDIDYKGQLEIRIYQDGIHITTLTTTASNDRTTEYLYMPLASRRSFQKIQFVFYTERNDTVIYGIEIDFSILKRRKNGS